jgi:ectoine hydroxylase-related dioxygenase (phytanoyl-CoA dioxygenase family)
VPEHGWHVDSHGPEHELPGVTVFVYLLPVAAHGGGTVVLPGSHRLFNDQIAAGRWRPGEVKGAILDSERHRARELTGQPGDVVLMHPRTLHAAAPNGAATPRMMLVEIVQRR